LYSDKIFIKSFFSGYTDIEGDYNLDDTKENFYDDLLVIYEVLPLLDCGYIEIYSPETDVCFSCQAKSFLGINAGNKVEVAQKRLENKFLQNMSVEAEFDIDTYIYNCDGPEPYFEHPMVFMIDHLAPALAKNPRILQKLNRGQNISVPKTAVKELGFHANYAHSIVSNAIYGLASSKSLRTSFLTENQLHIDFLNSLHGSGAIARRNTIAAKHLTSVVPYVGDVEINRLIKLREREEEAFINYRSALVKTIDSFNSSDESFSENDAKSLYAEFIDPSLALLDRKIKHAKRDLISKPFRSLAGVVGVISFGLLTGLVSQNVSEILKVMGLLKFGSDFIKDTMAIGDQEKSIENEDFYFLWKIRQQGRN